MAPRRPFFTGHRPPCRRTNRASFSSKVAEEHKFIEIELTRTLMEVYGVQCVDCIHLNITLELPATCWLANACGPTELRATKTQAELSSSEVLSTARAPGPTDVEDGVKHRLHHTSVAALHKGLTSSTQRHAASAASPPLPPPPLPPREGRGGCLGVEKAFGPPPLRTRGLGFAGQTSMGWTFNIHCLGPCYQREMQVGF